MNYTKRIDLWWSVSCIIPIEIKTQIKGLVVEYVLNSKKIAYVWRFGDANSTTIALPQTEMDLSFESLRVYIIGKNDNFLI